MVATLSFLGKELAANLAFEKPLHDYHELGSSILLSQNIILNNNILIRSENLDTLKFLYSTHTKFNIIYIDPPYNTGLKLTYKDSFKSLLESQDAWLCMIYPRIILAHKILQENGVIFVSIDDRENANLTILMREVFGINNHIGTIKWRKKNKPSFLDKHLGNVIEYILVFAKNKNKLLKLVGEKSTEISRPVLNFTNPISNRILLAGTKAKCKDGVYPKGMYTNRTLSLELKQDAVIKNGLLLHNTEVSGKFRVSQEILDKSVFITKTFGLRRSILESEQVQRHATDDATHNFESNEDAETQLKSLFNGEKVFDFPKPVGLLKHLISMYQTENKSEKIHCLDFFAGSATLAQAVYDLNFEKQNKYLFCCVQSEEKINKSVNYNGLYTVADIAQHRIRAIEEKYKIFPRCKIFTTKSQKN
ncbi:DNA methyltransferase [Fluviispira vulneris]|uniref:DNA methyltransferase n=1 Tax=Fluviispira vulneris TaxID=2763012 RepID=UPI00164936B1|nr:DNA methyltransferase [Fluviispira vulneris]